MRFKNHKTNEFKSILNYIIKKKGDIVPHKITLHINKEGEDDRDDVIATYQSNYQGKTITIGDFKSALRFSKINEVLFDKSLFEKVFPKLNLQVGEQYTLNNGSCGDKIITIIRKTPKRFNYEYVDLDNNKVQRTLKLSNNGSWFDMVNGNCFNVIVRSPEEERIAKMSKMEFLIYTFNRK